MPQPYSVRGPCEDLAKEHECCLAMLHSVVLEEDYKSPAVARFIGASWSYEVSRLDAVVSAGPPRTIPAPFRKLWYGGNNRRPLSIGPATAAMSRAVSALVSGASSLMDSLTGVEPFACAVAPRKVATAAVPGDDVDKRKVQDVVTVEHVHSTADEFECTASAHCSKTFLALPPPSLRTDHIPPDESVPQSYSFAAPSMSGVEHSWAHSRSPIRDGDFVGDLEGLPCSALAPAKPSLEGRFPRTACTSVTTGPDSFSITTDCQGPRFCMQFAVGPKPLPHPTPWPIPGTILQVS